MTYAARLLVVLRTAVLAATFAFSLAFASFADTVIPTERVKTSVIVRGEPGTGPSTVVGRLARGDKAQFLESVPYYYRVRLSNGVEGYVHKSWTRRETDSSVPLAAAQPGKLEIHFIDVGQGDSSLIVCPNGNTILIDAGSTADSSPARIREYLQERIEPLGLDIDLLVVTHPDADHYNLIREVLADTSIGHAFYVGVRSDYGDRTFYDWLLSTPAKSSHVPFSRFDRHTTANRDIDCGAAKVWILAASVSSPKSRKNAMSIVLMVRFGSFEAVMTGDATHATENVIMERYPAEWLRADVLKIGHHGSLATSTSKRWADTIRPETAIASAAYENGYGHPRKEVIDRLTPHTTDQPAHPMRAATGRQAGGPRYNFRTNDNEIEGVYSTAGNGTIKIVSDGQTYQLFLNQGE